MNKKKLMYIFSFIIIIIIIGYAIFNKKNSNLNINDLNNDNINENAESIDNEILLGNLTKKDAIDLIYKKCRVDKCFNYDNLEEFEILDIWNFGYFESKSNIRYFQVNYSFKCADETKNCNLLKYYFEDRDFYSFKIGLDLYDTEYLEIEPDFSININSDWIAT